jgi:hypothetical protein
LGDDHEHEHDYGIEGSAAPRRPVEGNFCYQTVVSLRRDSLVITMNAPTKKPIKAKVIEAIECHLSNADRELTEAERLAVDLPMTERVVKQARFEIETAKVYAKNKF